MATVEVTTGVMYMARQSDFPAQGLGIEQHGNDQRQRNDNEEAGRCIDGRVDRWPGKTLRR